jgi:hypothetical protein
MFRLKQVFFCFPLLTLDTGIDSCCTFPATGGMVALGRLPSDAYVYLYLGYIVILVTEEAQIFGLLFSTAKSSVLIF